jgi:hypothetical protein
MGKRGPAPRGEFAKSTVFSCRLQADTRRRLDVAKTQSGRSLGQELEWWLQRAFKEHDSAVEHYGSRQNEAICKLIGEIIKTTGIVVRYEYEESKYGQEVAKTAEGDPIFSLREPEKKIETDPSLWLRDPSVFDATIAGILHVLAGFRPGGGAYPFGIYMTTAAVALLKEVSNAGHSLPIDERPNRESAMADLKQDLGELARLSNPYGASAPLVQFEPFPVRKLIKKTEPARKARRKKK